MIKSYKYRIYPNDSQIKKFENHLYLCRYLYNSSLEERISFYKKYKKSLSCYEQIKSLPDIKEIFPEYKNIFSQVLQATLKQTDSTFKSFFKRKMGFPRFKNQSRFRSFLYPQLGFKIDKNRLFLSKIGYVKIKLHRPIEGELKNCRIIKSFANKWYVCLTCKNVPKEHFSKTEKEIGIDLGVKNYLVTSEGEIIENPKFLRKTQDRLKWVQKRLSKSKRKDPKRIQKKLLVARLHEKIKNQREDFQHKLSLNIVRKYDLICVEDLNIKDMKSFRNLNRAIGDCAWNNFIHKLSYKAESADKILIKVDPKDTTKMCSSCGKIVPKDLSDRIHECECGLKIDRDLNASINILNRGKQSLPRENRDIFSELPGSPHL